MHCYPPCIRHLVTLLINKCSDRSIRSFFPDRNCGHPPSPLGVLKCVGSLTSHRNNVSRSGRRRRASNHAGWVSLQDWEERNFNLSFNFLHFNNFKLVCELPNAPPQKKSIFCYLLLLNHAYNVFSWFIVKEGRKYQRTNYTGKKMQCDFQP